MSSWEAEMDCACYQGYIIDKSLHVEQTVDHSYTLKVKLKDTTNNLMVFEKSIKMESDVLHNLQNWAGVVLGSIDDFLQMSTPNITDRHGAMPWAQGVGFTGEYSNMEFNMYNGTEILTKAEAQFTYEGTITEKINTEYGTLDFYNLEVPAYHIGTEYYSAEATAESNQPMGYVWMGTEKGFESKWQDYVAFRDYTIETKNHTSGILNMEIAIPPITLNIESEENKGETKVNISDSVIGYFGDAGDYEEIYPPIDPESDGRELGFSHWMLRTVIASRWSWFRDVVDNILMGFTDSISPSTFISNIPIVGKWEGNVVSARPNDDGTIYMLGSWNTGEGDIQVALIEDGIIIDTPEGMTDLPCHPVCPL